MRIFTHKPWWKSYVMAFMLMLFSITLHAQTQAIKGKIFDEKGEPLPGATVRVSGTQTVATTNINGQFTINVAPGAKSIIISFVGYENFEKLINAQTASVGDITLKKSSNNLSDIVVVGYGTQRREAVTGSVASIGGDKLRDVPSPNITQALQGRLPGVEISQTSSQPGATMQILIRGARSLTASNDPLIVLDGIPFPGNIADINPNDVKSIDILKDASSTAIYGSRGANGVIIITTNRGQIDGNAKITYNAYYGIQTLFARYPMMNGPEFVALRKAAGLYTTNGADESNDVDVDWQKLLYRNGYVNSHDVGVSGGSKTGSYNFGGGYYRNQGLIPTQRYTRYSMRGSVDQQVGKYVKIGFTTNNNYNLTEGNQVGIYSNLSNTPIANPYNADGSLKRTVKMIQDESFVITRSVVEGSRNQWLNETRGYATYNSAYGEVKIPGVEGLKYRANLGLDFVQTNNGNYTGTGFNNVNTATLSSAGVANSQTYHWVFENLLTYDRTFAQKHNLNVVALYSAEQNRFTGSSMTAQDIPVDAFSFYNLSQAASQVTIGNANYSTDYNGNYVQTGLNSYMARAIYSYDNRYLISATLRSDGSSRLAPGHKWHTYPAVSIGWNLMNESFMKGITTIDNLKLRAGYGQTSNQAVNAYQTLGSLGVRQYNYGDNTYSTGYYVTQSPNAALGWEYSDTWNYGVDFSLLNHRLTGTMEYYVTDTHGLLLRVNLPPTAGVGSYVGNIGKTQNKGFELALNGSILNDPKGVTWDVGFNLYINKNKLVALASGATRDVNNAWFVGHNINAIYDYKYLGLWQQNDPYLNILEPGGNVGMIKVQYTGPYNANGQPTRPIGADDRQIIDVDPKFQGGFNTRVAYKGFDFNMVGAFKHGGTLVSTLYGSGGYLNLLTGRRNNIEVDYWTPTNTDARYPKPGGIQSGDNPKYGSTLGYFDASYLKIRTMTVGYDVTRVLPKTTTARARLYFTVQNPFVMFSPYHKASGMDPETNSYGDQNQAVAGYQRRILTIGTNAPSIRSYVLGVNVTF